MNREKKILAAVTATVVLAAAGASASVLAATKTGTDHPPLVQAIAERFNLEPAEVQKVFDEHKEKKAENRQQKLEDRLNQAVEEGKLTQAQKEELLAKLTELKDSFREDRKELKEDRQALRAELEQWAKANGIEGLEEILPKPGHGHRHHR